MMADLTTLDILRWGRALFEDPKRYGQDAFARAADGVSVLPCDTCATRFCSEGFLLAIRDRFGISDARVYDYLDQCKMRPYSIAGTHDEGRKEALKMWTRAIALAEKENHG